MSILESRFKVKFTRFNTSELFKQIIMSASLFDDSKKKEVTLKDWIPKNVEIFETGQVWGGNCSDFCDSTQHENRK